MWNPLEEPLSMQRKWGKAPRRLLMPLAFIMMNEIILPQTKRGSVQKCYAWVTRMSPSRDRGAHIGEQGRLGEWELWQNSLVRHSSHTCLHCPLNHKVTFMEEGFLVVSCFKLVFLFLRTLGSGEMTKTGKDMPHPKEEMTLWLCPAVVVLECGQDLLNLLVV